jgi:hypothetical protein
METSARTALCSEAFRLKEVALETSNQDGGFVDEPAKIHLDSAMIALRAPYTSRSLVHQLSTHVRPVPRR